MHRQTDSAHARTRGITMVEVIAALAVISGALVTLLAIRSNNLRLAGGSVNRIRALRLARSMMDETLALIRAGEVSPDDVNGSKGEFEAHTEFKWKFETSAPDEADMCPETDPPPEGVLDGIRVLAIEVSYYEGEIKRSLHLSTLVSTQ